MCIRDSVVGDVVLDDPEVGDAQGGHLGALPVLLEPVSYTHLDVYKRQVHTTAGCLRLKAASISAKVASTHSSTLLP